MKKFIIILVLLLVVGGAVFYLGWIQIRLPEHTYGVFFSKTGGWERTVLRPGTFVWRWEPLLPTNATLYPFRLLPQSVTLDGSGTLPSADAYAGVLDGNPDFSYRFEIEASYLIDPEALPGLVIENELTPERLPEWYDTVSAGMQAIASKVISEAFAEGRIDPAGGMAASSFVAERLESEIGREFPAVTLIDLVPRRIAFPDAELYRTGKQLYLSAMEAKRDALAESAVESARLRITTEDRIERLREYGELFTEYPILLQYLAIEQGARPEDLSLQIPGAAQGAPTRAPQQPGAGGGGE